MTIRGTAGFFSTLKSGSGKKLLFTLLFNGLHICKRLDKIALSGRKKTVPVNDNAPSPVYCRGQRMTQTMGPSADFSGNHRNICNETLLGAADMALTIQRTVRFVAIERQDNRKLRMSVKDRSVIGLFDDTQVGG
jgi:hypothetical protein